MEWLRIVLGIAGGLFIGSLIAMLSVPIAGLIGEVFKSIDMWIPGAILLAIFGTVLVYMIEAALIGVPTALGTGIALVWWLRPFFKSSSDANSA